MHQVPVPEVVSGCGAVALASSGRVVVPAVCSALRE
jgi:hypothetical protein